MSPHVCPWWLAYTFDNPLRAFLHDPRKLFAAHVGPGMTTADIGCGMGYFSLAMARLVQPGGKVLAVDLQPRMLRQVRRRAEKAGLSEVIKTHITSANDLKLPEPVDFALAFWMVHETPDAQRFFTQVKAQLKPGAHLLIAEPKLHIDRAQFEREVALAVKAGFTISGSPAITFSHAALLSPDG